MTTLPLMPKATAVWLVENTGLRFEQIAVFCGLHPLEVQGIADEEVAIGIVGLDPISRGQLSREEIEACESDPRRKLQLAEPRVVLPRARSKGPRYTPVSKRQDRPNAISWLLRYHPELSDAQISRMVGTTKPTINAIRERSHWNIQNIRPQDPVSLGLCSQQDLDEAVTTAAARERKRAERDAKPNAKAGAAGDKAAPAGPSAPPIAEIVTPPPAPVRPVVTAASPAAATQPSAPTAESVFGPDGGAVRSDTQETEASPSAEDVFRVQPPSAEPMTGGGAIGAGPVPATKEPGGAADKPETARVTLGAVWPKAKAEEETEAAESDKPTD